MKEMLTAITRVALLCLSLAIPTLAQAPAPSVPKAPSAGVCNALVDRVGSTGFIQLQAASFHSLDAQQRELAYWLSQASIAIDPIIYDQLSVYGIRQKRLLEEIVARSQDIPPATLENSGLSQSCSGRITAITTTTRHKSFCRNSRWRNYTEQPLRPFGTAVSVPRMPTSLR